MNFLYRMTNSISAYLMPLFALRLLVYQSFETVCVIRMSTRIRSVCHEVDFANDVYSTQCDATQCNKAEETEEPQERPKCKFLLPEADRFLLFSRNLRSVYRSVARLQICDTLLTKFESICFFPYFFLFLSMLEREERKYWNKIVIVYTYVTLIQRRKKIIMQFVYNS